GKLYTLRVRRIEDQATKPNRMTKEIAVQFRAEPRITLPGGLQAQYLFGETSGTMIHDSAGTDDPLELAIIDAEAVEWLKPGLAVRRSTLIVAERTSRLVEACREANALTIEAWIKPANINQAGPARIVSLSKDTGARNFTLGQTESSYIARLRTTTTSTNGMPETITPLGTVVPELTHVVFVREPSGTTMLYINGVSQAVGYAGGDLSNWEEDYQLTLANEVTQDRPWLGEFRVVRLYSRPLTMDEVLALYLAGPISIVP
ncbi:MAG: LamG domain-containing protein, partial [Candidatus Zipacnadales bacterium]